MQTLIVSPRDIGVALRELRRRQGLTQAELGRRVGLDQKRVSLVENGSPNSRLDTLFRLLSALESGVVIRAKADIRTGGEEW
jgi:HTH-type transcriptional regulator/antitoxin HipB